MIEIELVKSDWLTLQKSCYLAHYMTDQEIINAKYTTRRCLTNHFFLNIEKLRKDNWKLHKKLISEGVNQSEISKIIRNDEVVKLQEISSQNNFNFDQVIEPSLYEKYSFINKENVSLADYAAFFGSVKCFKFLYVNGSNLKNTGKYAVAGGNIEIIHLCEQNHSSFAGSYETAIEFHQNDIFFYLFDKKIIKIKEITEFAKKCISHNNYELLSFMEEKGMKINDNIIKETAKMGNMFLFKQFLKNNHLPHGILIDSIESGNTELIKFIIEKGVNINEKDVYLLISM